MIASCSVDDEQYVSLEEAQIANAKKSLLNVQKYFEQEGNEMLFLRERNYMVSDMRFELSRAQYFGNYLVIQTPVVSLTPDFLCSDGQSL